MNNPSISVVTPIYNCEKYISKLICSLENQTFKKFEAVFVDDCSEDNSVSILKEALSNVHFGYTIVELQENSGAGIARNEGMRRINGRYFCFIDSDDDINDCYLEEMYKIAEKEEADVVVSSTFRLYPDHTEKPHYDINTYITHASDQEYLVAKIDIGICGKLIRSTLWEEEKCGFPGRVIGEDGATMPVLYNRANHIGFAPSAVYYYYQTNVSRSRNNQTKYDDVFQVCKLLEKRLDNPEIVEYKFALHVGYGVIRRAIQAGAPKSEVMKYVAFLKEHFPNAYKNKYIKTIKWQKRIFIRFSYTRAYHILKIMVYIVK